MGYKLRAKSIVIVSFNTNMGQPNADIYFLPDRIGQSGRIRAKVKLIGFVKEIKEKSIMICFEALRSAVIQGVYYAQTRNWEIAINCEDQNVPRGTF